MGVLPALPQPEQRWPFTRRVAGVPEPMASILVRYLERKSVTCRPSTVSGMATRLAHFARIVAAIDPRPPRPPWTGSPTSNPGCRADPHEHQVRRGPVARRAGPRILAVGNFLTDITEWEWPEAPPAGCCFPRDTPRLPQPLPRYLPPDADRRLTEALQASPNRLAADALLLRAPAGCVSASCSTSSSTPSTTCPAPDPGSRSPWASSTPSAWCPSTRRS